MRLNCVCSCSSARGRRSGPGGWPGRSSRFLYQSQGCKEGRDCGGSHEPLNVREAGLLTVIEGCTAEQLKLGGGLCPLVIGGRVQKLRPDQQRPLRAPHQRGQVIRTEWGQVLRSTWCWCCTSSSTACTRGRSPPPLRPTVILVAGAGQLATTLQLSLSKSPSGPILCFPKFDEGLVRLLLNARPAGDRRPDLSRQAEGGHDTVQLEAWTLAPYPDSSQQRAVVVLVRQGGVPVSGARVGSRGQEVELVDPGEGPRRHHADVSGGRV